MSKKIFVSYKYADAAVRPLPGVYATTARNYVDELEVHLEENDHIYKGEPSDGDLSNFKDDTIASSLRDRIHDSTVTVVLVSKNMKESYLLESDQWIPWEIAYSLREQTRNGRTSGSNAIVAVGIPDENGSYAHFILENTCVQCGSRTVMTNLFFGILRRNMFNRRLPKHSNCSAHSVLNPVHEGDDHSYIYPVKWDDFITDMDRHLGIALDMNSRIHEYDISKTP
jgi:hypothetical protein